MRKNDIKKTLSEIEENEIVLNDEILEAYRFYWFRRQHQSSIIVSLYPNSKDNELIGGELIFKEISKSWWNKPYVTETLIKKSIDKLMIQKLRSHLLSMDYWNFPEVDNRIGLDGSDWIFEAKNKGHYHIVRRWSPLIERKLEPFSNSCIFLLRLSGIDLNDKNYFID